MDTPTATPRNKPLPELLLPAGSFETAIAAFEGGADAVYLGFKDFSARRQARNLDTDEYRRVLKLFNDAGRRVYVTLNTVILDSELPEVAALLAFLERFPPQGIIVQDWGLASLVRERFGSLPLHASTQTAIQGPGAARLAAEAGVSRIVLPRETSPLELAGLVEALPGLEFEVFVHGALCYSYSGLCLASGLLLGRSGNRGDCAQLCRSWYEAEGPGLAGRGHWFSCKDLDLSSRVEELHRAGAASLKVEGRMKSPEYAYAAARLYRGALDRVGGTGPDDAEMESRLEALRVAFSRSTTVAWAGHHGGADLIDPGYPGHRGLPVGTVTGSRRGAEGMEAEVELSGQLSLRDGLLALVEKPAGEGGRPAPLPEALAFSASALRLRSEGGQGLSPDRRSERELLRAMKGSRVFVPVPRELPRGQLLFRISSRDQDRRLPSREEFAPLVGEVPSLLSLEATGRPGMARLLLGVELPAGRGKATLRDEEELEFQASRTPGGFTRALALFAENGDRDFRLEASLDPEARLELGGPRDMADLFAPPSLLKKAKNRLYELADAAIEDAEARRAEASLRFPPREATPLEPLPERRLLVFPHPDLGGGMPWATPRVLREALPLPRVGDIAWLPLSPLVAKPDEYEEAVVDRVLAELRAGTRLRLGIGALHHAALARRLRAAAEAEFGQVRASELLDCFGDIHLYLANGQALAAWRRFAPGLAGAYGWIEALAGDRLPEGLSPVGPGFDAPYFLSKGCLLRSRSAGGRCPTPCAKHWALSLADRDRRFLALVEDCVTWFLPSRSRARSSS